MYKKLLRTSLLLSTILLCANFTANAEVVGVENQDLEDTKQIHGKGSKLSCSRNCGIGCMTTSQCTQAGCGPCVNGLCTPPY